MPKANEVLARVRDTLQDPDERRWVDFELLRYLDDALAILVQIKPEVNAQFITVNLTPTTRQTLPDTALFLIDIPSLEKTQKDWFDRYDPAWQSTSASGIPVQWMQDVDKEHFYVYPPPVATTPVELQIAGRTTPITLASEELPVKDEHVQVLASYVTYRALIKDGENELNRNLAQTHLQEFYSKLGMNVETEDRR